MRNPVIHTTCVCLAAALSCCLIGRTGIAQDKPTQPTQQTAQQAAQQTSTNDLYAKFQRLLTGAKLRGKFTVDGQPLHKVQEELYEISKVEKMATDDDLWALTTRIKYGEHDLVVPIAVEVKWAGSTPVITLDELTIPGLGTFSARVLLHKDKYSGTWQHGPNGGHLFGHIELADTK